MRKNHHLEKIKKLTPIQIIWRDRNVVTEGANLTTLEKIAPSPMSLVGFLINEAEETITVCSECFYDTKNNGDMFRNVVLIPRRSVTEVNKLLITSTNTSSVGNYIKSFTKYDPANIEKATKENIAVMGWSDAAHSSDPDVLTTEEITKSSISRNVLTIGYVLDAGKHKITMCSELNTKKAIATCVYTLPITSVETITILLYENK